LTAVRVLLAKLGIEPGALLAGSAGPAVPTFAEYVPVVAAAVTVGTSRTYRPYWARVVAQRGERRLDHVSATEIKQLAEQVKASAVIRRNSRGGRSAVELLISALRCLYHHAVADGLVDQEHNPAGKVGKPRRRPSSRHALPEQRLAEINRVAATTGNDPELDSLLLPFHTETACRRGGALALRTPQDLDPQQCLVRLFEKGAVRWQPVSATLMAHLQAHAQRRHAPPGAPVFRYRNGQPITARRYDYLWSRAGICPGWPRSRSARTGCAYTTLTWVERNLGYAIALGLRRAC